MGSDQIDEIEENNESSLQLGGFLSAKKNYNPSSEAAIPLDNMLNQEEMLRRGIAS